MALGFDSSVLSPFARAERLDILEQMTRGDRCVVTRAVLDEIDQGCNIYPADRQPADLGVVRQRATTCEHRSRARDGAGGIRSILARSSCQHVCRSDGSMSLLRTRQHPAQELARLAQERPDPRHRRRRARRSIVDRCDHVLGLDDGVERGMEPRQRGHVSDGIRMVSHAHMRSKRRAMPHAVAARVSAALRRRARSTRGAA